MEPTVKQGSRVLVKRFFIPKKNNIVALYHPTQNTIILKRIIEIRDGNYFVGGDNLDDSIDSRDFGSISRQHIIGRVVAIL